MNLRNLRIRSYQDAEKLLNGYAARKVANNTWLVRDGYWIDVVLYSTSIVTYWPGGDIQLYARGWKTTTTKDRMNRCLPDQFTVWQKKKEWYLYMHRDNELVCRRAFVDGMMLRAN